MGRLLLFVLVPALAATCACAQVKAKDSRSPAKPDGVTFSIRQARLADAVVALHTTARLNIIADAYIDDLVLGGVSFEGVAADTAARDVASAFGRQVTSSARVLIMRDPQWIRRLSHDAANGRLFPKRWDIAADIRLTDQSQDGKGTAADGAVAAAYSAGSKRISIQANERLLGEVVDRVAGATGWKLQLDRAARARRVTLMLREVTGGEVCTAVLEFLNRAAVLTPVQNPEQRQAEAVQVELMTGLAGLKQMSRDLKGKLLPLLAPAQLASFSRGERVMVRFNELPPLLRNQARTYAEASHSRLQGALPSPLEWNRASEFRLGVDQDPLISIYGFGKDGRVIGF